MRFFLLAIQSKRPVIKKATPIGNIEEEYKFLKKSSNKKPIIAVGILPIMINRASF